MSDRDIDLERVVSDPAYRRRVIDYLNKRNVRTGVVAGNKPRPVETPPRRVAAGS